MLEHLGKDAIPVVIERQGYQQLLRCRKPGDLENKDVFHTWLFFRRTQNDDISITVELAFHSDHFIGLYRDSALLWSSLAMYGFQIDADIVCYLATHCESLLRQGDVPKDYRTQPHEDEQRTPSVVTSGDVAGRFATRVFETVFAECFPVVGGHQDPMVRSLKATRSILGLLAGNQEDFPRVDLVVAQTDGDVAYRKLLNGEQFVNGTQAKMDVKELMDVPLQHDIVKAWLKLCD